MKKFLYYLGVVAMCLVGGLSITGSVFAAQTQGTDGGAGGGSGVDNGINNVNQGLTNIGQSNYNTNLLGTIKNVLGAVFVITGIIAAVVIIIGGINYALSQGDPGKIKKAKDTILYGIVGLVVSLLAFAIVQFVLDAVAGKV